MAKAKQEFDLAPLISKVKENPLLYDKNHEDYGNQLKTSRAWNTVARELLLPNGEVVRSKWRSTSEIFIKNLKGNKKNATKWPWMENMKFFEPYLINGKKVEPQKQDNDKHTSATSKKTMPTKRQRSPVEIITVLESSSSVEQEYEEVGTPTKKTKFSVIEQSVQSNVASAKGSSRKSTAFKARGLSRSALESEVRNKGEASPEEIAEKNTTMKLAKLTISPSSKDSVKIIPIEISPQMKRGPRRLPRSVLKALEAEASSTSESSQQSNSSDIISSQNTKGSRRFSRSALTAAEPKLTPIKPFPPRSLGRFSRSSVLENFSCKDDNSEIPGSTGRFSTSNAVLTGAPPSSFRETFVYFESPGKPISTKDKMSRATELESRSTFILPTRHSISTVSSSSHTLPRSAVLEAEFARHDALIDSDSSVLGNLPSYLPHTSRQDPNSLLSSDESIDDIDRRHSQRLSVAPGSKDGLDATDLLFLSHALTVKSFSERKQLEVKRRIAQIIAQAEVDEVNK